MKRRVLHSRHIFVISKLCMVFIAVLGVGSVEGDVTGRLNMKNDIVVANTSGSHGFLHKDTTTDGFDVGEDVIYGIFFGI